MIKKLLLSLLIIAGVSGSAVVGTRALLSDSATLSASTFSTGSVDLQIASNESDAYADGPVNGFSDQIRPGQSKVYAIWLKNNTSDVALALSAQAVNLTGTQPGSKVTVAFTQVGPAGQDIGGETVTKTLTTWDNVTPTSFGSAFNLAANTGQRYRMTVSLDSTAGTGDFGFSFVFTGTQVNP